MGWRDLKAWQKVAAVGVILLLFSGCITPTDGDGQGEDSNTFTGEYTLIKSMPAYCDYENDVLTFEDIKMMPKLIEGIYSINDIDIDSIKYSNVREFCDNKLDIPRNFFFKYENNNYFIYTWSYTTENQNITYCHRVQKMIPDTEIDYRVFSEEDMDDIDSLNDKIQIFYLYSDFPFGVQSNFHADYSKLPKVLNFKYKDDFFKLIKRSEHGAGRYSTEIPEGYGPVQLEIAPIVSTGDYFNTTWFDLPIIKVDDQYLEENPELKIAIQGLDYWAPSASSDTGKSVNFQDSSGEYLQMTFSYNDECYLLKYS